MLKTVQILQMKSLKQIRKTNKIKENILILKIIFDYIIDYICI